MNRELGDLGGDLVDALAQQRVFGALGGPGRLGLLLDRHQIALQLAALVAGRFQLLLGAALVGAQLLDFRVGDRHLAALAGDRRAQLGVFRLELFDPAGQRFRLLDLGAELAVKIGNPVVEVGALLASLGQFAAGEVGGTTLLLQPLLGGGEFLLGVLHLGFQRIDFRMDGGEFAFAAVGGLRAFRQIGAQPRQLVLLRAERLFGGLQRLRLGGKFLLGGFELLFEPGLARLQCKDRGVLFGQLMLQAVDGLGLLAKLGELARGLVLELVDIDLELARRHREFGAQLVLVGLDLGPRHWRSGFEPPCGEPYRAVMHQRYDHQPEQHRHQKTDRQIHDRLDHRDTPRANWTVDDTTCGTEYR